MQEITRRSFFKSTGFAATAGIASIASISNLRLARADETGFTFADTIDWSAAYDVVVIGSGFSGMISAMEAADAGASVLIVEKAPEGESGGNSRVCGQLFAYAYDDEDVAYNYYTALTAGRKVPEDLLRVISNGVAHMATTMSEKYGMPREDYVDWTNDTLGMMSPEYPEFLPNGQGIALWSTHRGYSDAYLFQNMRERLAGYANMIDVWFESPAVALLQDPATNAVIGVTVERNSETRNVRADRGVCLCCGGYENDPEMVQNYLGVINYAPIGGLYNTGDGIRMAQEAGAKLWHMSAYEGGFSWAGFGYNSPEGDHAVQMGFYPTGAAILVGGLGRRFANEIENPRHGHLSDGNGIWENPHAPQSTWAIWDQAKMDAINESGGLNEDYRDTIVSRPTIGELAEALGIPQENLELTIARFNEAVEIGEDLVCGRPTQTMSPFDGVAYYAMPMKKLILNTQGGPQRNAQAQVLNTHDEPIPHLYSAGELGGITSCMYQGGTNVAECFIMGQIAGAGAATKKDPLPTYVPLKATESTPAGIGDETDLAPTGNSNITVPADNALVGSAKGIGGDVIVAIELDEAGAIKSVEVISNNETQGIGSKAIETMPEMFIGLSTSDEIDAVDGVSGASVTSQALRNAVKAALAL